MKTKSNQNRGRTTSKVGEILLPRPAHVQIKGKNRRTGVLGCVLVLGGETRRMEKQKSGANEGEIMTMREG